MGARLGRLVAAIVDACARRALLTVTVSLVLAALAAAYTVRHLAFVTSPVRLLPQHARYVVLLREDLKDFGDMHDLIVAVDAPHRDVAKAYAPRLVADLRQHGVTGTITYRVDPERFAERALLFLSVDDLVKLRDGLFDSEGFVQGYAARPSLARLADGLNRQLANAMAVGFFDLGLGERGTGDLRFVHAVLDRMLGALDGRGATTSPWRAAFSLGDVEDDEGYFFSADDRLLFLFIEPPVDGDVRDTIRDVRAGIRRLRGEFPAVQAGVTGADAISSDEMATAFADSKVATALAFALTLVLLFIAFRRAAAPIAMLLTLAVSLTWSLGLIALVVGQLNVFSIMFISIVVGIGIDYGIYFLYRYDEERALGLALLGGLRRGAERSGPGILLGAVTAAGTFLVLVLTDFQGIREFGLVSGIAILAACLSMITLFPATITLLAARRARERPAARRLDEEAEARWLVRLTAYRRTILVVAAALTALSIWGGLGVRFSSNLLKLQARGTESVAWEERLHGAGAGSGFAALATASTLDELRRKQAAFSALPSVAKVDSVLRVLPDHQGEKLALVRQLAPLVAPLRVAAPPAFDGAAVRNALLVLRRRLGLMSREAAGEAIGDDLAAAETKAARLLARLDAMPPALVAARLAPLQMEIARDFADEVGRLQKSLAPRPIALPDLPRELRDRYIGASGRFLVRIRPAVDIWERAGAARFVGDLRSVDPDVTGPPVTSFEAIGLMQRGYFVGTLYALALVALVTAATLRSARSTALALTPLVLGVLWTLGLMRVFGLSFTLANVWAFPLVIGTAAEFGLNIFVRSLQARESGGPALGRSTVMAVVLNGGTTMAGFGSLMVASHRGIFGLGLLLTVGCAVSLFASLAVLPVLVELGERAARRASARAPFAA